MDDIIGFLIIGFVVILAVAAAIVAVFTVGAIFGMHQALVCYATSLKRTYGASATYAPGAGMQVLCAFVLLALLVIVISAGSAIGLF